MYCLLITIYINKKEFGRITRTNIFVVSFVHFVYPESNKYLIIEYDIFHFTFIPENKNVEKYIPCNMIRALLIQL